MNEENFRRLDSDDDIVMLEKDTFTVGRLKELLSQNFKEFIEKTVQQKDRYNQYSNLVYLIDPKYPNQVRSASIAYFFNQYCYLPITDKSIKVDLSNILLIFPPNGIECKVLELDSRKRIEGKLRIHCNLIITGSHSAEVKVELEFSPAESKLAEESTHEDRLDDLRAKLNQLNQG
jgi:hypothetical protein